MKNRAAFKYTLIFFILFFSMAPDLCSQDGMGSLDVDIEISTTALHEWMPSVTYNPVDNEFLALWHTTGVREEGGERMYSLHSQRISYDGKLLGEAFSPVASYGPERRLLPRAAHNPFTNEYMVVFGMGQEATGWDPFITILDSTGSTLYGPAALSQQPTNSNHINIVFNSVRRQYFIVYNDSRNGVANVYGIIVDEDGTVVKEDIPITTTTDTAEGGRINAVTCYNSIDDTYLVNWEDFRNVSNWGEPGDIYGALLDGDGNILVNDIPMVDDHGTSDEGDQRVQDIAYNPDRNEFLASWWDSRPSLVDESGVVGRIISSDGSPSGPDFTVADASGSQTFPHLEYIEEKELYFGIWVDTRNEEETENADIYAKWLDPSGEAAGPDIPICTEQRGQKYSEFAYNPVMDRFLIVWRDEVEEEVLSEGGSGHVTESGGDVMGEIYGVPSFLTGRVVEQGTGTPVEGARVAIIGLGLLEKMTTNIGGWCNIVKGSQRNGRYFIIVWKKGYRMAIQSVTYEGEPLQITIEIK